MALRKDNITTTLVANTISFSGTEYPISSLCSSSNIEMWSRMKPVNIAKENVDRNTGWWRGDDSSCGINSSQAHTNDWRLVNTLYSKTNNGYSYKRRNAPYRLADFGGYEHNASGPASDFVVTTKKVGNDENAKLKALCIIGSRYNDDTTPGSLSLWDIGTESGDSLGNFYMGIVVFRNGINASYVLTSNTASSFDIDISTTGWSAGSYTAYPILSTKHVDNGNYIPYGCEFYAIPGVSNDNFEVVSGTGPNSVFFSLTAQWAGNRNRIEYKVYVNQTLLNDLKFSSGVIRFLHGGFHEDNKPGDFDVTLSQFSVPNNGRYNLIKEGNLYESFMPGDYYVKVYLTSSSGSKYNSGDRDENKVQEYSPYKS